MRCRILAIFLLLCGIACEAEQSAIQSYEKSGDYAAAFELCMKTPDEAFSAYFIGDYLFHGRKGIVQNPISGRKSYLKAIPGLTVLAKEGNADAQYYLGRCYEYGKNDNISANTTEGSGVQAADATLYCIKITVNATDLFGTVEKNDDGSNKTAYVHWNIDNDNNANSGEPTKHLGGDYLKTNMTVNGEDDLKSFSFTMTPAINKGSIEISIGSKGKVWKNATKGVSSGVNSQLLLDAGATKVWDLSNVVQRNEFNGIGTVYIEGVGNGNATFTIKYKDDKGTEIASDHISYTFIAANCGNQPLVNRKTVFLNAFPGLVGCEWSVTGEATISYNCIAWTVGITDKWVNAIGITGLRNNRYHISIDTSYGNGDGIMTMDELDAFYDANGYTVTDSSSADIMYYSKYHGARKKRCSDGAGKWEMFESKCGALERIEHLRDQLNGDLYGFPVRYYKAK